MPPGEAAELDVTLDAAGLPVGTYGSDIEISSNDPATPVVVVPADFTVVGAPNLELRGERISVSSSSVRGGSPHEGEDDGDPGDPDT